MSLNIQNHKKGSISFKKKSSRVVLMNVAVINVGFEST